MPENHPNSNPIMLTLDQMIKYVKGNLLGIKKQEVEDRITASPLLSDAIEGMGHVKNPEKMDKTIDELNRQIQLKSGAKAVVIEESETAIGQNSSKSTFPKYSIAASIALIIAVSVTLYFIFSNRNQAALNSESIATLEESEPIAYKAKESNNTPTKENGQLIDSYKFDSVIKPGLLALNEEPLNKNEEAELEIDFEDSGNSSRERKDYSNETIVKEPEERSIAFESEEPEEEVAVSRSMNEKSLTNAPAETLKGMDLFSTDSTFSDDYSGYDKSYKLETEVSSAYSEAIELLEQNKLDDALNKFESVADNKSSPYIDDANWNIAQIQIKKGNDREAKKALKKIKNSSKYGVKAKGLLDEL